MPNANNNRWERGQLAALAHLSGVSDSHLSQIISRRLGVSAKNALKLTKACETLKIPITLRDWLESKTTPNPYFGNSL
jgi:DNA-binding transcriptional regulator YdaS (Cro superfamily)